MKAKIVKDKNTGMLNIQIPLYYWIDEEQNDVVVFDTDSIREEYEQAIKLIQSYSGLITEDKI